MSLKEFDRSSRGVIDVAFLLLLQKMRY